MTPATIIREARADGVSLCRSPSGTIKATGDTAAVSRWLNAIREHRAGIIDALGSGTKEAATAYQWWRVQLRERTVEVICLASVTDAEIRAQHPDALTVERLTPSVRKPLTPMTSDGEAAIRAWLALIEETDPATIAEVMGQCQRDKDARDYFTGRAAAELPKPDPFPDDRRTCDQCANLIDGRCKAARRGERAATISFMPIRDLPNRCPAYEPGPEDTDRRHGRERWTGTLREV